ncbi:MAG: type II toxin-antitoxin system prevent-host-death family antitoxin [Gammaproteobacteria bacterium]|nr:type II toxin-antitoxin system prevent-host-death family antitoxin [Gammaproteobacteria bacterium]
METIKASEFKAKCLALMDEVARTGDSLVITKNGKPVAMLAPYGEKRASLAGLHRGAIEILGDIVSPLDEPWEADR